MIRDVVAVREHFCYFPVWTASGRFRWLCYVWEYKCRLMEGVHESYYYVYKEQ